MLTVRSTCRARDTRNMLLALALIFGAHLISSTSEASAQDNQINLSDFSDFLSLQGEQGCLLNRTAPQNVLLRGSGTYSSLLLFDVTQPGSCTVGGHSFYCLDATPTRALLDDIATACAQPGLNRLGVAVQPLGSNWLYRPAVVLAALQTSIPKSSTTRFGRNAGFILEQPDAEKRRAVTLLLASGPSVRFPLTTPAAQSEDPDDVLAHIQRVLGSPAKIAWLGPSKRMIATDGSLYDNAGALEGKIIDDNAFRARLASFNTAVEIETARPSDIPVIRRDLILMLLDPDYVSLQVVALRLFAHPAFYLME